MRKKILLNIPILLLVMLLTYSCENKDYDLDNLDTSGVWQGAVGMPAGTLSKTAQEFLIRAGENNVSLPITYKGAETLQNSDLLDCDLTDDNVAEKLTKVVIWLNYNNTFKHDVALDFKFLDSDKKEVAALKDLFRDHNGAGIIEADTEKTNAFRVELDQEQLDGVQRIRYIRMITTVNIASGESFTIKANEGIDIKFKGYGEGGLGFELD
ncbi:MAG: hypothetical protein LBN18_04540 [Dysgonamonadaceae bacterium]|jgi:hypothetical protein|nr:hypothetical protein [Dysgonamonadaceae bacterium]